MKKKFLFFFLSIFIFFIFYSSFLLLKNSKNSNFYVYTKDFLSEQDFFIIQEECRKYNYILENDKKVDQNMYRTKRKNMELNNKIVRDILNKDIYKEKIRKITENQKLYLAKNFPIEYRKYSLGSFMKRHSDKLIYSIPQYECIFTISNNSDCKTVFYEDSGNSKKEIQTIPNSIMIVRAQGIEHEVLPLTRGERYFLKFIFTETDELL